MQNDHMFFLYRIQSAFITVYKVKISAVIYYSDYTVMLLLGK